MIKNFLFPFLVLLLVPVLLANSQESDEIEESDNEVRLVQSALSFEGMNYAYGAAKQNITDCSGLVRQIFFSIGIDLPRSSLEQYKDSRLEEMPFSLRRPGDLIFFKNTYKKGISHVAMLIDRDHYIHASSKKRKVIIGK